MKMAETVLVLMMSTLVLGMVWGVAEPLQTKEDEESTNYHFSKVKQKIDAIKMSLRTSDSDHFSGHDIAKRSAEREADDLILNSFASYCHNFNSDPEISEHLEEKAQRQPLSTRDMGGYSRYNESSDEERPRGAWDFQAFPVKVMAQKEDDTKTWIVVHVAHTENARVSWLHFKDFHEVVLKLPESTCHTIVSKARFELPSCHDSRFGQFRISSEMGMNAIDVYVDVCKVGETNEIVTRKFNLPFFRLKSSTKPDEFVNHVVLQNDNANGTSVDVNVRYERTTDPLLTISLTLWDWDTQTLLQYNKDIIYEDGILEIKNVDGRSNEMRLFNVESLDRSCDDTDNEWDSYCLKLRITVKALPGKDVSGQLSFHVGQGFDSTMDQTLMYGLDVTVPLVTSGRTAKERLPQDLIYFGGYSRFWCKVYGNDKHNFVFGIDCVMQCQAYGRDISHIYISKRLPSNINLGHDSGSYVLPTKAVALLNVGHADDEDDGEYECTAVTSQGTVQTTSLFLYTRLFTRVESLTVDSSDPEKALVTCRVSGDPSVEISLSVSDDYYSSNKTQLDIGLGNILDVKGPGHEHEKELSVYIPWKELRYPREYIYCEAEGDRGGSSHRENLDIMV